jgi:hypothetical protein
MQRRRLSCFVPLLVFLVAPPIASAQDVASGTLTGVIRDDSGAVLPGVTVEAASPALIEKVRAAVSDGEGRYRIPGLRPGTYSVTFTLPGFKTTRRDGIELTTGFVATVNADLSVGAVEETITVTGAASLVDTKSSSQQQVFSGEVVRELPLAKTSGAYVAILPGAVQNSLTNMDVGGNKGETENQMGIHGGRPNDAQTAREGNYDGQLFGPFGTNGLSTINPVTIQEVTLQLTGGLTAEAQTGGVQSNVVMRDGGNVFSGSFLVDYTSRSLQSSNVNDALRSRGVTSAAFVDANYDVAAGIGGAIIRDKVWFFGDVRRRKAFSEYPGQYYNKLQGPNTLFYEADLSRPGISGTKTTGGGTRFTWQTTPKNKVVFTLHYENACNCYFMLNNGLLAPEASQSDTYSPYRIGQVNWTLPATNRVLVQAGVLTVLGQFVHKTTADQAVTSANISITDRLRNYRYGAPAARNVQEFAQVNTVGSVSYVAGTHALKVGGFYMRANRTLTPATNNDQSITYTFAGRVPESVTLFAYPLIQKNNLTQTAFYAQDQWTLGNLTLNLGARLDLFNGYAPEIQSGAGRWVGERRFPATKDIVDWKDFNPRLGAAYNLFGSDRTALKVNIGRFSPYDHLAGVVATAAPAGQVVANANRTWLDANGDYVPQESELGPLSNAAFGTQVVNTRYDDRVVRGWQNRSFSWQGSVLVQHELRSGLGVNVGYFRTWYGNFAVTDNVLVTPADFDSYCITGPADSRLPGGGGEQICGMKAIRPALFGLVDNVVKPASDYGAQREVYNGIDLTVNARFGSGGLLSGGLSTAQTVFDNCDIMAALPEMASITPQAYSGLLASGSAPERFCHVAPAWSAATQFKMFAVYPLPWDLRATAVYQNVAGAQTTATYVLTNAQVTPLLGRPLAGGVNSVAQVELIEPRSVFDEGRINQINFSVSRSFRAATARIEPTLSLFNALNSNPVLLMNLRYGPAWQNVQGVLPPRMIKFGVKVDF